MFRVPGLFLQDMEQDPGQRRRRPRVVGAEPTTGGGRSGQVRLRHDRSGAEPTASSSARRPSSVASSGTSRGRRPGRPPRPRRSRPWNPARPTALHVDQVVEQTQQIQTEGNGAVGSCVSLRPCTLLAITLGSRPVAAEQWSGFGHRERRFGASVDGWVTAQKTTRGPRTAYGTDTCRAAPGPAGTACARCHRRTR